MLERLETQFLAEKKKQILKKTSDTSAQAAHPLGGLHQLALRRPQHPTAFRADRARPAPEALEGLDRQREGMQDLRKQLLDFRARLCEGWLL